MKRTRWWNRYRKIGTTGRAIWFWEPDREPEHSTWIGTEVLWTNRWFWVGRLAMCWLSREYITEEGL